MLKFLSIDIGGSKSKFIVFDETHTIIESFVTRGFGVPQESEEEIPELDSALMKIAEKHNICSAAVNLGGKNKNQIASAVKKAMPGIPVCVYRESEATAAIMFGKSCGANVVLLAGTGTIAVGTDSDGQYAVCGGWGMNIGDGGSGYSIGLEAIKQSLAALDSCNALTPMQQDITGLTAPLSTCTDTDSICQIRDGVRSRIYPQERRRIASYCKLAVSYCEKGEADALSILKDAGRQMGHLVLSCINKLGGASDKVAVSGGLVNCRQFWQDEFERIISDNSNVEEFVYEADGVSCGTRMLAINQYNKRR